MSIPHDQAHISAPTLWVPELHTLLENNPPAYADGEEENNQDPSWPATEDNVYTILLPKRCIQGMYEPYFPSLDEIQREELQEMKSKIWSLLGYTVIEPFNRGTPDIVRGCLKAAGRYNILQEILTATMFDGRDYLTAFLRYESEVASTPKEVLSAEARDAYNALAHQLRIYRQQLSQS